MGAAVATTISAMAPHPHEDEPVSLAPLDGEEALRALLGMAPEASEGDSGTVSAEVEAQRGTNNSDDRGKNAGG